MPRFSALDLPFAPELWVEIDFRGGLPSDAAREAGSIVAAPVVLQLPSEVRKRTDVNSPTSSWVGVLRNRSGLPRPLEWYGRP
jgi:hypothetical protein